MMARTQITLDPEMHKTARRRAAERGISLAEYIRSLIAKDLASPRKAADPSILFGLGRSAGSDIARNKDAMIAEAFGQARLRKNQRPRRKAR